MDYLHGLERDYFQDRVRSVRPAGGIPVHDVRIPALTLLIRLIIVIFGSQPYCASGVPSAYFFADLVQFQDEHFALNVGCSPKILEFFFLTNNLAHNLCPR